MPHMHKKDFPKICHLPTQTTSDGFWNGGDPLRRSLPLFMLQVIVMMAMTRIVHFLLRPLKQPRVVSEVVAGIILGPSVLGRSKRWRETMFPAQGDNMLRTVALLGMVMFLFLIGVKMDPVSIFKSAKKPLALAISGMFFPLVVVTATAFALMKVIPAEIANGPFLMFVPASISVTAFPNLGQILGECDLLNSELGQMALHSSLINDAFGWFFMALFTAIDQGQEKPLYSLCCLGSLTALIFFFVFVFRPWANWINRSIPRGGHVKEMYVTTILMGTLVGAFTSDFIGATIADGPLIMGLAMPDGPPLGAALLDKSELIVMEVFLPLLYVMSGMSTDLSVISNFGTWSPLFLIMFVGYAGKIVGTVICGMYLNMYAGNALILALIMSFRGIVEIMTFLSWETDGLLDDKAYTVLLLSTTAITAITVPLVSTFYKPYNQPSNTAGRTISQTRHNAELRVLACVHNPEAVPNVINFLESIHTVVGTRPMCVYALNMVELVGRSAPLLIAHAETSDGGLDDPVLNAFFQYEQRLKGAVIVQPYTTISPYKTMHQDICRLAEDKAVAMIIMPFRRKDVEEAIMSRADQAIRTMTPVVLATSPCSVCMLVHNERTDPEVPLSGRLTNRVGLIFWGGPDDREALAVASRMAENDAVTLTVSWFEARLGRTGDDSEQRLDEDAVHEFANRYGANENVAVLEVVVNDAAETIDSIKAMGRAYDLLIVGRRPNLCEGLTDFSECPELGALGDMFASMDVQVTCSVLVVQQHYS